MRHLLHRSTLLGLTLALLVAGCAASGEQAGGESELRRSAEATQRVPVPASTSASFHAGGGPRTTSTVTPAVEVVRALDTAVLDTATPNPYVDLIQELPAAPTGEAALTPPAQSRQPTAVSIAALDIASAPVVDVGVNTDQSFEVPPADLVGWYRHGPSPGEPGSAVLAAHIAFDGVDGVFRNLGDLDPGDVITVTFDDGTSADFRVDEVREFRKEALPGEVFAKDGDATLTLITCGGDFNRQARSYESNTVVVASPA